MSHPDGDKHHYVPERYLRRWADAGEVGTVNLVTGYRSNRGVRVTAMERGFYAVASYAVDPNALEKSFNSVEDPANRVLAKILEGGAWPLLLDDRVALGAYVALQALRGPDQRRLLPSSRNDALGHGQMIATHADAVSQHFLARQWTLSRFVAPTFITSDAPVSLHDVEDGHSRWNLLDAPSVTLPLSRTTALVLGGIYPSRSLSETEVLMNGAFDREVVEEGTWAARLNARTVHNSARALFHHPDDAALVPTELPPPRD